MFIALRPAHAAYGSQQQKVRFANILPPVEYDKPYTGELEIVRLASEQEIQAICKVSKSKYACAFRKEEPVGEMAPKCRIFMLIDKQLRAYGSGFPALVMRHELGHCNGWDKDHKGGRKTFIDTRIEMPKLPPSTKELPTYPPVVCVTPDWKQEPCKNRTIQAEVS